MMNGLIDLIVRDVAELPDRTSPDDHPEMMAVADHELRNILFNRLDGLRGDDRALAIHANDCPPIRAFYDRYALGPKTAPSCLVCGQPLDDKPAVQHAELPGIVVCRRCKEASIRDEQGIVLP